MSGMLGCALAMAANLPQSRHRTLVNAIQDETHTTQKKGRCMRPFVYLSVGLELKALD